MATTLGCSDIGIRKLEFVVKTQFLYTSSTIFLKKRMNDKSNVECKNTGSLIVTNISIK